jgi:hypothetical protein
MEVVARRQFSCLIRLLGLALIRVINGKLFEAGGAEFGG